MTRRSLRLSHKAAQASDAHLDVSATADEPISVQQPLFTTQNTSRKRSNESDEEEEKKERKSKKTKMPEEFRKVRGKCGLLEKLAKDVPLDIMFEIFCYLDTADLLSLARTTRDLRSILMSRSSELIWLTARSNLDDLPPLPGDLSEPQYADLLFGSHCYMCNRKGSCEPTFWSFRVRYCRVCAFKTFPHFQSLKRAQPEAYRDDNILPRETISGIYKSDRRPTPARPVGHAAMAERLKLEFEALSSEEKRLAWIEIKRQEQEAVREHGFQCKEWYKAMLENRETELYEQRKEAILKKLEELELREEAELIIDSSQSRIFLAHPAVDQPKKLTEQAWRKMKSDLVEILTEHKEKRIAAAKALATRSRYGTLRAVYGKVLNRSDLREPFPPLSDILIEQFFHDLIQDTPPEDDLTEEFFTGQLTDFLPGFLQQWRPAKIQELVNVMQKAIPNATAADLPLATTVFSCTRCETWSGYRRHSELFFPEMFFHECCSPGNLYSSIYNSTNPTSSEMRDRAWKCCLVFNRQGSGHMKEMMERCGLNPQTTTVQDLFAANLVVECLDCFQPDPKWGGLRRLVHWSKLSEHLQSNPEHKYAINTFGEERAQAIIKKAESESGYSAAARDYLQCIHCNLSTGHTDALEHLRRNPEHKYVINPFGEETQTIVKKAEHLARDYLRCVHCNLFTNERDALVITHLEAKHSITNPTPTLKSLQEHWYWDPRMQRTDHERTIMYREPKPEPKEQEQEEYQLRLQVKESL